MSQPMTDIETQETVINIPFVYERQRFSREAFGLAQPEIEAMWNRCKRKACPAIESQIYADTEASI